MRADVFVFGLNNGRDVVRDFDRAADRIDLSAFGFADFNALLAASQDVGIGVVIKLGADNDITLLGVSKGQLADNDFIFGGG